MTTVAPQIDHSVAHGTFTLERTYGAPPRLVFAAWATRQSKNAWFGEGDDFLATTETYELDFQVGGRERLEGILPSGNRFRYDAVYNDIVDERRIICTYEVYLNERRISVSLMTIDLTEAGEGSHLVLTEQGAFLDAIDTNEERILGATDMLDQLGKFLARPS